ncbi:MAG: glycosyltransferase family 4 protein, partial [bacterium]|nr:glycosyltransferase family 4 protein [bacterium]
RNRDDYETVLVHLSPEYLLVAGLLWRLLNKRVGFWYNDSAGGWRPRLAAALSDVIFYSNPNSFAAHFPHARKIPMGVDIDMYTNDSLREPRSLLFLGRISPAKHLDVILSAVSKIQKNVHVSIFGAPGPGNSEYADTLRSQFRELEKRGTLVYRGSVPHEETPIVYGTHEIFVHVGTLRGFNKTLLEAMAAGTIVITSEPSMRGVVDDRLFVENVSENNVARALHAALSFSDTERAKEREQLRAYVRREHSLSSVVPAMLEMLARPGGETRS